MRKLIIIPLTLCILICCVSCSRTPHSDDYLHATGSFAIPGMNYSDLKGIEVTCEALENDNYGRVLFKYRTYNNIMEKNLEAYVIMQKHGEASKEYYVCFYEDICYSLSVETESDLLALKALNDWEQPLNDDKMTNRRFGVTLDGFIQSKDTISLDIWKIRNEIDKSLPIGSNKSDSFDFVDDGNGKVVCTVLLNNSEKQEVYFAITDKSYEIKYIKVTDISHYPQVLSKFKQDNGWNYGNK